MAPETIGKVNADVVIDQLLKTMIRLIRQILLEAKPRDTKSLVSPREDSPGGDLEVAGSLESLLEFGKSQDRESQPKANAGTDSGRVAGFYITRFDDGWPCGDDAARREDATNDLLRLIRVAAETGASRVSFPVAIVQAGVGEAVAYQDALNRTHDLLPSLSREAEVCGVSVCVQVARFGFLMSPPETRELLDGACSHAVGADVAIEDRCDQAGWRDWLSTLGRLVQAVCVADDDQAHEVVAWLKMRGTDEVDVVIRSGSVAR